MAKYRYRLEVQNPRGEWVYVAGGEMGLEYGRGYIAHQRHAPGPRCALRLVRDDGRVMDEAPGLDDASIGMVAGWPSWQQYARAAVQALEHAAHLARQDTETSIFAGDRLDSAVTCVQFVLADDEVRRG